MSSSFTFDSAAVSHVGKIRKINEDSLIDRPEIGLWAVADGMGGHGGGDVASGAVVKTLAEMRAPASASEFLHEFELRIANVNNELQRIASERAGAVIGTTLVAILVFDAHYACAWCGDSRGYLMRNGELNQITRDHSEVQDLIDSGMLSREEAKSWPGRNVVTRAVGAQPKAELDVVSGRAYEGDRFLLCSDGLVGHLSDEEIAQELKSVAPNAACSALVEKTLERGASDNVSVIVFDCRPRDDQTAVIIQS
jgi:protein phosphatase